MTLPQTTLSPAHSEPAIDSPPGLAQDLPDAIHRIITGYTPRFRRSAWDHVRSFVIECVLAVAPTTPTNARRLMTMTSLYVSWVWGVTGCELTIPRMFQTHLVDRYVAERFSDKSEVYRYDTVRQLSAIAEKLAEVHVRRLRTPDTPCARPYTPKEEATLYSWANTLTTPLKRRNAKALLGLCGGGGLSAQELMDVQVQDIEFTDGHICVNVRGPRARRVPVLKSWSRTLAASIDDRSSGNLFHAHRLEEYKPHGLQQFLSENAGPIRASSARLRSGWIVTQIDANLPMQVLLEITGFTSLQSLQPYLEHCVQQRADDYLTSITGEVVA